MVGDFFNGWDADGEPVKETAMTDLIEQLRDEAIWGQAALRWKAADEIERLQKHGAMNATKLAKCIKRTEKLAVECLKERLENKVLREDVLQAQDSSCEAYAQLKKLEAALNRIATGQYDQGAIGVAVNALAALEELGD